MIIIEPRAGAIYPVVRVSTPIPPDLLAGDLYGVDHLRVEDGTIWPIWYAAALAGALGDPHDDYSRGWLHWVADRDAQIRSIRDGTHPLLTADAPGREWMDYHQRQAWAFCRVSPVAAIYHDPGMGKTATMITVIHDTLRDWAHQPWRPRSEWPMQLVVTGNATLLGDTWERELDTRAPGIPYANLNRGRAMVEEPYDLYLISRHALMARRASMRRAMLHPATPERSLYRVIFDESSVMANADNATWQIISEDYGAVESRILLSGEPAPNNVEEYWPQIHFLAPGLLPATLDGFRKAFSRAENGRWVVRDEHLDRVMGRIARVAIASTQEDHPVLSQLKIETIMRTTPLPDRLRGPYELMDTDMRRAMHAAGDDKESRKGAAFTRIMRLRELCTGYIVSDDEWKLVSTHRFDLLERVLDEIGSRQAVVWMNFEHDFLNARRLLPHRAERGAFIWGKTLQQSYRRQVLNDFREGKHQYLFAQTKSIRHGLTLFDAARLEMCRDVVFFNPDHSWESLKQAQFRVKRLGQRWRPNCWILACENTIETEEIMPAVDRKAEQSRKAKDLLR